MNVTGPRGQRIISNEEYAELLELKQQAALWKERYTDLINALPNIRVQGVTVCRRLIDNRIGVAVSDIGVDPNLFVADHDAVIETLDRAAKLYKEA